MGEAIKPTQVDMDIAKVGIDIQFNSMFDEPARTAMEAMGIQKFVDHMILLQATDMATIRFYSSFLHPKSDDN